MVSICKIGLFNHPISSNIAECISAAFLELLHPIKPIISYINKPCTVNNHTGWESKMVIICASLTIRVTYCGF